MSDPVPASAIYDASAAGLSMLTAADAAAQRSLMSVYSTSQVDAIIGGLTFLTSSQIDTLAEINAILGDADLVAQSRTITAGTGLSGGGDLSSDRTINLANTAVTAGSYTAANITVDAQGRITSAASGSAATPGGSSGQVQYNDSGAFGGMTAVVYAGTGTHVAITSQGATIIPLCLKGAASQSGNLFEWRSSAGALRGAISAAGTLLLTQGDQYGCTLQNANFGPGNGLVFGGTAVFLLVSNNGVVGRLNTGGQLELTNSIILSDTTAPATAASAGTAGDVRFDANYMYRCVSTNTWKRVALSTW